MSALTAARREALRSFITETVFSHRSKVLLVEEAVRAEHQVVLHVVMVPVEVSVARVRERVELGGHQVPEHKIRARFDRLWTYVKDAARVADRAVFCDNSRAVGPFVPVAEMRSGALVGEPSWPAWARGPASAYIVNLGR